MPRLLNRGRAAQNRRNTRTRIMAAENGTLLSWIPKLERYQKLRVNTGRKLNRVTQNWENCALEVIRRHFRDAGASNALPRSRLKLIAKLRNVYANALAIANAQRQLRDDIARRNANERRRRARPPNRVTVPSLNRVQFGKRTNGRGPNVIVVSPQSAR
jgi:hypothetical protein